MLFEYIVTEYYYNEYKQIMWIGLLSPGSRFNVRRQSQRRCRWVKTQPQAQAEQNELY